MATLDSIPERFVTTGVVSLTSGSYASWAACFAANPNARGFRLASGDYSSWGDIQPPIGMVGTAAERRFIMYATPDIPPWRRLDQARIQSFSLGVGSGQGVPADYWVLSGLTQDGSSFPGAVWFTTQYCVIDSHLLQNMNDPNGIRTRLGAQNNTFQRIVARSPVLVSDGTAFQLQVDATRPMHGNRWLCCEVQDYNDGFQITQDDADNSGSFNGTLVDDCDFYLTDAAYTQLADGVYAEAENAIDLKGGSNSALNPVTINNCRAWGYRRTIVGGAPSGSDGAAVVVHFWAENVVLSNLVIWDCPLGYRLMQQTDDPSYPPRNVVLRDSVIANIRAYNTEDSGQAIQMMLADRMERCVIANCQTLTTWDAVNGPAVLVNNTLTQTPLGLGAAEWAADSGNKTRNPSTMGPLMVVRKKLTGPETVNIPLCVDKTGLGGLHWAQRPSYGRR